MRGEQGKDHGVRIILTLTMTERGHDANRLIKH